MGGSKLEMGRSKIRDDSDGDGEAGGEGGVKVGRGGGGGVIINQPSDSHPASCCPV